VLAYISHMSLPFQVAFSAPLFSSCVTEDASTCKWQGQGAQHVAGTVTVTVTVTSTLSHCGWMSALSASTCLA